MSSRHTQFRSARPIVQSGAKGTCPYCRRPVIWARIRGTIGAHPGLSSKRHRRAFVPFIVESCDAGAGNISLTAGLFFSGEAPLAEVVGLGTGFRAHREHCPSQIEKPAAPARAHSAAAFAGKKGGAR